MPDDGLHREPSSAVYVDTAAAVVEVFSPGDETFAEFGYYAAHGVDEIIVADRSAHSIRIWCRTEAGEMPGYDETGRSDLLGITAAALIDAIDWP